MSMIGEYMRLAPHDLELALADPEAIRDLIDELWDLEDAGAEPDQRLMDVDKAWHGLAFVLDRAGVPAAVVYGDQPVPDADDWGYGPPSWLSVERVAELSTALRGLDAQAAVDAVSAADLVEADIYPQGAWAQPDDKDYLVGHLKRLTEFFAEAADAGMGLLVWID
ncbi:YfbM family protein [Promicromonospora sukumoe]|uniref:YfbM family protein n=1 Tax=Promicromonospora sukumoe TaxID=88382 RepID=UPI003659BEA7